MSSHVCLHCRAWFWNAVGGFYCSHACWLSDRAED